MCEKPGQDKYGLSLRKGSDKKDYIAIRLDQLFHGLTGGLPIVLFPLHSVEWPLSDISDQCGMGFHFRIRKTIIRATVRFIPGKVLTTQLQEPLMNHLVIIVAD